MSSAPSAAPGDATQPSGEAHLIERAIAAYRRREWTGPEKLCRAVLAANANNFDARHLLGTLAVQTSCERHSRCPRRDQAVAAC